MRKLYFTACTAYLPAKAKERPMENLIYSEGNGRNTYHVNETVNDGDDDASG